MATIHPHKRTGVFRISFYLHGRRYHKSLRTIDEKQAEARKTVIEELLALITSGVIDTPEDEDLWTFLFTGGKVKRKPEPRKPKLPSQAVTLKTLFDRYQSDMPPGTLEASTLATIGYHRKHLLAFFGNDAEVASINLSAVQQYVNKRAKDKRRGKPIVPLTIKKEVATLRSVWNWGKSHGLVVGDLPIKDIRYEKEEPRLPFMTWGEIENKIARGGLTPEQIDDMWDALFLTRGQIAECLDYAKSKAIQPWIYPMLVCAAHTGARRSELIRSEIDDFDFARGETTIRQKKGTRNVKFVLRQVPMTPLVREVMTAWLAIHPGGQQTFAQSAFVAKSRKRADGIGLLKTTLAESDHHFETTFRKSKWEVMKGWHVFRHSFASNLAAEGVSPDVINDLMGHKTDDMRLRYRHLQPHERTDAVMKVFG